jgi:Rrf2 family protein
MISRKTKYALNALVHLTKQRDKGPVLISQIAESEKIPQKFLEAILLDLKRAGILGSKKGKGGGYYLIKSPDLVSVADIMRLFDGPIALLPCVTYRYYEKCEECKDEETCGIRDAFLELRNTSVQMLKGNTLSDLILRENKLTEARKLV